MVTILMPSPHTQTEIKRRIFFLGELLLVINIIM